MAGIIFSKSSGVNDSVFGKSQEPIKAIINEQIEAFQNKSLIDKIYTMETSTNFAEKYTMETSIGDFVPVGENGAYPDNGWQEGFSKVIEPEEWKNRFTVTQAMVEDNKISRIKSKSAQFTTSYGRTREKFGAALLAAGTGTKMTFGNRVFDVACADGTAMFNASHPSATKKNKYVQSNLFKAAFSTDVMDQVQERMQDFCDDDGNLLSVMPDTIIIPNDAALKRAVFAAVGSDLDPDSNNNAINFQIGLWNILVWNYLPKRLGGESYFFMMDSQFMKDYICMPWVDRVKLSVRSYIDENTDANVFAGRARFGAGFNNWRGISLCGAGFSSGTELT